MKNFEKMSYLTPENIAEMLQVTRATVINWVNSGKLKAIKVERVIRVPRESFENFLEENAT